MTGRQSFDKELTPPTAWCRDRHLVAGQNFAMRLRTLAVDRHLSALARALRFRPGLVDARHIQPHIYSDLLAGQ